MFIQLINEICSLWTKYSGVYLRGLANTLILAVIATVIGCIIGFACGILQTIPVLEKDNIIKKILLKLLRILIRVYIEVFRGTPMILQAVFIYYGVPYFTGMVFKSIWSVSIIVVSINTGAYMAESVRGGIMSIDRGQGEGAMAIGMTHFQAMLYVILPQTLRNILPQIGNNYIINVKDTSVMFIIGFSEFFAVHKMVSGACFKYFPSATIEMVGYLTATLVASFLLRALENKLSDSDNYELLSKDQLLMTAGTYNIPEKGTLFTEKIIEFQQDMDRD